MTQVAVTAAAISKKGSRDIERGAFGLIFIDRVGSTNDWDGLTEEQVQERHDRYQSAVDEIARSCRAWVPVWEGDGTMLFLPEEVGQSVSLPHRVWQMALLIWEQICVVQNLSIRMALHAASGVKPAEAGRIRHPDVDLCGHLGKSIPGNSIIVSDEVYVGLPHAEQDKLRPAGITIKDGIFAYIFPRARVDDLDNSKFRDATEVALWQKFREFATGPMISYLSYVGFRTSRPDPPRLKVTDVFISPQVDHLVRDRSIRGKTSDFETLHENEEEKTPTPWRREKNAPRETLTTSFAEMFRQHRSLIVMGEPGSGKTTLMRWLAVTLAEGRLVSEKRLGVSLRAVPFLISVGRLAEIRRSIVKNSPACSVREALEEYFHDLNIERSLDFMGFLKKRMEAGECLFLFDGLDEVPSVEREAIRDWICTFAGLAERNNRFVVTSRIVGYISVALPESQEVVLCPFDDDQVRRYVEVFTRAYRRWETGGVDDPAGSKQAADELLEALEKNARLNSLARNPFILSAMVLIHRAEGKLPRHRVSVYNTFARALCETWGTARRLVARDRHIDIAYEEEAIPILGKLGLEMHRHYPDGAAPRDFVVKTLSDELCARSETSGDDAKRAAESFLDRAVNDVQILVERGPERWGFLHLTFQEFFAAVGLHAIEKFEAEAMKRLFDPRWEEVIRLGIGYMSLVQGRSAAAESFVRKVLEKPSTPRGQEWIVDVLGKNVPLAAILVNELGDTPSNGKLKVEIAIIFLNWIKKMPQELDLERSVMTSLRGTSMMNHILDKEIERCRKGRSTGIFDDHSTCLPIGPIGNADRLVELLQSSDQSVRWLAVECMSRVEPQSIGKQVLALLAHSEPEVRAAAAEALGNLKFKAAEEPLLALVRDESPLVRSGALFGLVELGARCAEKSAMGMLKDSDSRVRANVISALSSLEITPQASIVIDVLSDGDHYIELEIGSWIASNMNAVGLEEILLQLSKSSLQIHNSGALSIYCGNAIRRLKSASAIPSLVKLFDHQDSSVREFGIRTIGKLMTAYFISDDRDSWLQESSPLAKAIAIQPLLRLLDDPEPRIRSASAEALGNIGGPGIVERLVKLTLDPEAAVRCAAADSLGKLRANEDVDDILKLVSDHSPYVRRKALQALYLILHKSFFEKVKPFLSSETPGIRSDVAASFIHLQSSEIANALILLFNDPMREVRNAAAGAFRAEGWRSHSASVEKKLVLLLKDDDIEVRITTIRALGNLKSKLAVIPLLGLLKSVPTAKARSRKMSDAKRDSISEQMIRIESVDALWSISQ